MDPWNGHESESMKRDLERASGIDIEDEDISLLMSTLKRPLTKVEISYLTRLKLIVCCAHVRKLMNSGLLCRFSPGTTEGLNRRGVHVCQASERAISILVHGERY